MGHSDTGSCECRYNSLIMMNINYDVGIKNYKPWEKQREQTKEQEAGKVVIRIQTGKIALEEHPDKKEEKEKGEKIELVNPVDPVIESVLSLSTFCPL